MAAQIARIRVYPGIGMSRLGDSDKYFIGPESPGEISYPGGTGGPGPNGGRYRDDVNRLKRQAQRFRLYGYDAEGNLIGEVKAGALDVSRIRWRVHVRNMKAANYAFQGAYLFDNAQLRNPGIQADLPPEQRTDLIIDPQPQYMDSTVAQPLVMAGDCFTNVSEGKLPGYLRYCNYPAATEHPQDFVTVSYTPAKNIELGQLRLDDAQRLLFIPAPGKAGCVTNPKIELSNPSESHNPPNGPVLQGDEASYQSLVNQFAYFNVPAWWDDTCGGEIDATVELADGTILSTRDGVMSFTDEGTRNASNGGWVVSAPPKYAPYMYHVVSLLDRVYEAFPESDPNYGEPTEFYRDVYPILARAVNYGWVSAEAAGVDPTTRNLAHGPKQAGNMLSPDNIAAFTDTDPANKQHVAARKQIYAIMRHAEDGKLIETLPPSPPPVSAPPPREAGVGPVSRGNQMPKLWGTAGKPLQNDQLGHNIPNQYLSLTDWQLARMNDWAENNFTVDPQGPPSFTPLDQLPLDQQPAAMNAAALEPTIGGGFHPGIEFPYLICYPQLFEEAFRVKEDTSPGSVAAYMSSPWHGDYWSCNTAWWPVQRPDIVFQYDEASESRNYRQWFRGYGPQGKPLSSTDGYNQMVYAWSKLGMVLPAKNAQGELLNDNGSPVFQEYERDSSLNSPPPTKTCY